MKDKPQPKHHKPPTLDWHEVQEYLEDKYQIKLRCEHDFWHWICRKQGVNRGSYFWLGQDQYDEESEVWVKEILELIFKEFGNNTTYWVEW